MKNIISMISCWALILAAPQVQAAPKAFGAQEKVMLQQRTAALPAGFAQEQGELTGLEFTVVTIIVVLVAVAIVSWSTGVSPSKAASDALDNAVDNLSSGTTTGSYSPSTHRGYSSGASSTPIRAGYSGAQTGYMNAR